MGILVILSINLFLHNTHLNKRDNGMNEIFSKCEAIRISFKKDGKYITPLTPQTEALPEFLSLSCMFYNQL